MKTNRVLILFVTLATLGTTLSAYAQYGWRGYSSNVAPTMQTQNQAAQAASSQNRNRQNQVAQSATKSGSTAAPKTDPSLKLTVPKDARLLAFGVDNYPPESGLGQLDGCVNDANAVKETFDYAKSKVLVNDEATYDAIRKAMEENAGYQCDRLTFFFGGHGINVNGRSFLCPFDAKAAEEIRAELAKIEDKDKVVEEGKKYKLIPLADILNALKEAKATEVLVVLDACRDSDVEDSEFGGKTGDFMQELIELAKDEKSFDRPNQAPFAVLTSCSKDQKASEYENDGQKFGLFTHYWLEGVKSGLAEHSSGLADGRVTLVEAYNYAYSKTYEKTHGSQTPERYMSNVSNTFVLKVCEDPSETEKETDLQFMSRTGRILANVKWSKEDNKVGEDALDCVLKNVPNDVLARASRASLRRKQGNYEGALDDYVKIGEKFQLYAVSDPDAKKDATAKKDEDSTKKVGTYEGTKEGTNDEIDVHEYDLLTITKIEKDRYYVSEVNNDPEKHGWIDKKLAGWSLTVNGMNVATATKTQNARVTISSGGMVTPGNNAVTGAFSFVGPLGH